MCDNCNETILHPLSYALQPFFAHGNVDKSRQRWLIASATYEKLLKTNQCNFKLTLFFMDDSRHNTPPHKKNADRPWNALICNYQFLLFSLIIAAFVCLFVLVNYFSLENNWPPYSIEHTNTNERTLSNRLLHLIRPRRHRQMIWCPNGLHAKYMYHRPSPHTSILSRYFFLQPNEYAMEYI